VHFRQLLDFDLRQELVGFFIHSDGLFVLLPELLSDVGQDLALRKLVRRGFGLEYG